MTAIRIVLIEDHKLTRMGLKAALQQQPDMICVGEAANATSGLTLLQEQQPDVAVVDIGLPDMDGIEMVRRFRANCPPPANTRILMLTMHETEKSVMAAFTAGADSYCMKQTELDDLMAAIRETYDGNSWIDPAIASIVLRQARQAQRSPSPAPVIEESITMDEADTVTINAIEPEYAQVIETYPLTERELEILQLIVAGNSNASIAETLFITVGTVKTHVRNILNKLSASDRTQAAVRALRAGLVE
ncbi:MAG: response regulator transcription factor [Leptolyngbyaceae bacterium]|nr:response regulator transcription factor [Leptolyngbyaceae bacterium]